MPSTTNHLKPIHVNTIFENYEFTVLTTGFVNNIPTSILVDTGSFISIINDTIFNQIKKNNADINLLPWDRGPLIAANNGQLTTLGKCVIDLKFGNSTQKVSVAVVKNCPYNVIMGINILFWLKSIISFEESCIIVDKVKIPVNYIVQNKMFIFNNKNVTIPPRCQLNVEGIVFGICDKEGIIEDTDLLKHKGLKIARSINTIDGSSRTVLRILNTNIF